MKKHLLAIAVVLAGAASLSATTVIPPTFEQLVDQAQVIFHGSVTNITSQWVGEGAERHIVSYITFYVKEALKGAPGRSLMTNLKLFPPSMLFNSPPSTPANTMDEFGMCSMNWTFRFDKGGVPTEAKGTCQSMRLEFRTPPLR